MTYQVVYFVKSAQQALTFEMFYRQINNINQAHDYQTLSEFAEILVIDCALGHQRHRQLSDMVLYGVLIRSVKHLNKYGKRD